MGSPLRGQAEAYSLGRDCYRRAVGKIVYLMNVSLDGFIETPDRGLDWTVVDEELHRWFNDQTRATAVMVYGRRLYETMAAYWPTGESNPDSTPAMVEFARIWNSTPVVVFSTTLDSVVANSRLERGDLVDEVERLRAEVDGEISVGGPTLAAELVRRGLVDEYRLVVHPVVIGAGKPFFPPLDTPLELRLVDTRRFGSGAMYLAYTDDSATRRRRDASRS
jgi:dihydrofolate reductase